MPPKKKNNKKKKTPKKKDEKSDDIPVNNNNNNNLETEQPTTGDDPNMESLMPMMNFKPTEGHELCSSCAEIQMKRDLLEDTTPTLKFKYRGFRTSLEPFDANVSPQPTVQKIASLVGRKVAIEMTDGRVMVGEFVCIDSDKNFVLNRTHQYQKSVTGQYEKRFNADVIIPGKHVVKVRLAPETLSK